MATVMTMTENERTQEWRLKGINQQEVTARLRTRATVMTVVAR